MSGINRQPSGLLSFLGIKNTGRNPDAIASIIAPTIDLKRWYLDQNSESYFQNTNVAAVGLNAFLTVPETETWAVLGATVNSQAALGAGQSLRCGVAWARNPNALVTHPLSVFPDSTYATGNVAVAWSPPDMCTFVPPGAVIGVYAAVLAAGPILCTLNLTYVRMLT